ncbi:MAG: hypothetical protein WCG99_00095 [Candidatus Berkelbacteria bacterium]
MDERISKLEQEINAIKNRNSSVQTDKAWETNWVRRLFVAVFTYLSIGIYMWAINIDRPWLNAIVPTVGFLLSTLTLPFIKRIWMKRVDGKN